MQKYRFSPIQNRANLIKAVRYVATETSKMCREIIGKTLPIHSLTIFSHFDNEFENLKKILSELGEPYNENNGPRVKLYEPILVETNAITHLRIRIPDPERPQVGCNDFDIDSYQVFESMYLPQFSINLTQVERSEYNMIEFHHPSYDVLAYVVSG